MAHEINNPLAYVANNLASLDRDVRALMNIVVCYEQAMDLVASARPEIVIELRRLDEECDLDYIKEHLGKMLDSTRQGVKRVADIVHNFAGSPGSTAPPPTRSTSTSRSNRPSR